MALSAAGCCGRRPCSFGWSWELLERLDVLLVETVDPGVENFMAVLDVAPAGALHRLGRDDELAA